MRVIARRLVTLECLTPKLGQNVGATLAAPTIVIQLCRYGVGVEGDEGGVEGDEGGVGGDEGGAGVGRRREIVVWGGDVLSLCYPHMCLE